MTEEGALSWEDFKDVAPQCLEPLIAASELNLLHRDLKPGNIMLTTMPSERFLVKILDFGLAKFSQQASLQTLDQKGSFLGSIDYIAPEQLELKPLDQRTDLYFPRLRSLLLASAEGSLHGRESREDLDEPLEAQMCSHQRVAFRCSGAGGRLADADDFP